MFLCRSSCWRPSSCCSEPTNAHWYSSRLRRVESRSLCPPCVASWQRWKCFQIDSSRSYRCFITHARSRTVSSRRHRRLVSRSRSCVGVDYSLRVIPHVQSGPPPKRESPSSQRSSALTSAASSSSLTSSAHSRDATSIAAGPEDVALSPVLRDTVSPDPPNASLQDSAQVAMYSVLIYFLVMSTFRIRAVEPHSHSAPLKRFISTR
jgi:hypothetical protein